jgi:hypothetical protein
MPETAPEVVKSPGSINRFGLDYPDLSKEELTRVYTGALAEYRRSVKPEPEPEPQLRGVLDYISPAIRRTDTPG